jgi:hypothetical protein
VVRRCIGAVLCSRQAIHLDLILRHVAEVVVHGIGAVLRQPGGGHGGERVGVLGGEDRLQLEGEFFWSSIFDRNPGDYFSRRIWS